MKRGLGGERGTIWTGMVRAMRGTDATGGNGMHRTDGDGDEGMGQDDDGRGVDGNEAVWKGERDGPRGVYIPARKGVSDAANDVYIDI